ncbi:EutP/PduV family microcompartment system protein [Blautia liquoris]|uniref:EutP/PduV family microcompartment system protein n=1 Tax=Blautia liquoris TaxID=2779518 RepID=A0A7M2RHW4_9FIRM|nr:EutP/PduV family microcompartment system protein [Blautia liquoris]QOV19849.1 EutP/PduV family microcompartment system protein [Blautia liquoris]
MDNKKKKRVILIGRSMAGKTTMCQYMNHEGLKYHKTQTIQLINDKVIDTPGEYLERTYMRGALQVTAVDADVIAFVQGADEAGTMFSPGYASMFGKPCIGIVTKSDLASEKQIEDAKNFLRQAGAQKVFVTSSYEGTGFEELIHFFEDE